MEVSSNECKTSSQKYKGFKQVVLSFEVHHVYTLNIFLHLQTVAADATARLAFLMTYSLLDVLHQHTAPWGSCRQKSKTHGPQFREYGGHCRFAQCHKAQLVDKCAKNGILCHSTGCRWTTASTMDLFGAVWLHVCHSSNHCFSFTNMTYITNNLLSTPFVCHTNMRECKLHCVLRRPLTIVYTNGNVFTMYSEPGRKLTSFQL